MAKGPETLGEDGGDWTMFVPKHFVTWTILSIKLLVNLVWHILFYFARDEE